MAASQGTREEEITPYICCQWYLCSIFSVFVFLLMLIGPFYLQVGDICYMDIFANSVSVSTASNVSAANWRIGFVTRSPVTGCKTTLRRPIITRLLRGDKVIMSKPSSSSDFDFLQNVVAGDETMVGFETAVLPPEVVNGSVIWDFRVEIVTEVKEKYYHRRDGLLMVYCGDIPVKFTVDQAGNVTGSLLGFMRRCDYLIED